MAYTDVNTPVIERITLPSGNSYYVADRELRDVVDVLSQTVAGGVKYIIAWDGNSTPVPAEIPEGVKVTYEGTEYTGTLSANSIQAGAFYLVKSKTSPSSETYDVYDEYAPVGEVGSKTWEKIGDTQINLSDVVTGVTLVPATDSAIGADASFTVTQPTISLATGAEAGEGVISVATGASANNTNVAASASGANTDWDNKDSVAAVIGYDATESDTFVKSITTTKQALATTSIAGVSGSTVASKASEATAQTTATGSGTSSQTNTDWLKGVSVQSGVLSFGAATLDTQTTTQQTFADVTVPVADEATIVATGKVAASDLNGDSIVTDADEDVTASALTALGAATTDSVIGADSTFAVTQPTIALATNAAAGEGVVSLTSSVSASTTNIGATASGANTEWNNKDEVTVLTSATDVSVTKGTV